MSRPLRTHAITPLAFLLFATGVSVAQVPNLPRSDGAAAAVRVTRRPDAPNFGTSSQSLLSIGYADFTPSHSGMSWSTVIGVHSTSLGFFHATPHLPSGVLLTYVELDYCDTDPSLGVQMWLSECDFDGQNCSVIKFLTSNTAGSGCNYLGFDLTPLNHRVDNFTKRLFILAETSSLTSATQLVGAYIGYKLQVSPAPASATFTDVPVGHQQFRFVEALVAAGVTAGCGGNNFCPDQAITRGQMAVFLAVALGLHFPN